MDRWPLHRRERGAGARDHRPLPASEVGDDPAVPPRPGAGRLPRPTTRWPTSPSWSACTAGRGARHRQLLRDVQAAAGREVLRQRVHEHLLPAARRRGAAGPRRGDARASAPGGTTSDGMFTLEDVECIAACTEAPALPGELPLLPPPVPRRLRRADRRPPLGRPRRGIPPHGTLGKVRQDLGADRIANITPPEDQVEAGVDRPPRGEAAAAGGRQS